MLIGHNQPGEPMPHVGTSTYLQPTASRPAHILLELEVEKDFNPANLARQSAAEERLIGGTDQVCGSIDNVATRHLQVLTGTKARIVDEGYALTIEMDISVTPEYLQHDNAFGAGKHSGPALTAGQELALPELVRSIAAALPPLERHKAETLALMAAKEIPPTADVVRSIDRVTLPEVIEHHERRLGIDEVPVPASIRLAGLSFPQHPGAALHNAGTSTAASAGVTGSHRTSPDLER